MDCNKVRARLAELRRAARRADRAIQGGDNLQCRLMLDVIEIHIQAIRAEMIK
jgi:hypothetical protein